MFLTFASAIFGMFAVYKNSISALKHDLRGYGIMASFTITATFFIIMLVSNLCRKNEQLIATIRRCITKTKLERVQEELNDFVYFVAANKINLKMGPYVMDYGIAYTVGALNFCWQFVY